MKKILTFLCAAALVACGKDDKGGENPTPTPPHYDNLSVATNTVSFTTLSSTHWQVQAAIPPPRHYLSLV